MITKSLLIWQKVYTCSKVQRNRLRRVSSYSGFLNHHFSPALFEVTLKSRLFKITRNVYYCVGAASRPGKRFTRETSDFQREYLPLVRRYASEMCTFY